MRASEILNDVERLLARYGDGGNSDVALELAILRKFVHSLAATQAAVEELARNEGTGPARRIKSLLDGAEIGGVTDQAADDLP